MTQVCDWITFGLSLLYTIWTLFFNKYMQILVEKF